MNSSASNSANLSGFLKSLFSPSGWKAAGVGAVGAFAGSLVCEVLLSPFPIFDFGLNTRHSLFESLFGQGMLFGISGAVLSIAILAWDNYASLRGRWHRDLLPGAALFLLIAFMSGAMGQLIYGTVGLTRSIPWLLAGAGIGAAIGLLRRDPAQARRGALGGALGGLLGGLLVDGILALSYTDAAFALGSLLGVIVTGAMIALFMRAVQDALKNAWLLGISTGVYEGKEYPLNTMCVTVGQTELNDIALYRDRTVPLRAGTFVFQNGSWHWHSAAPDVTVLINGHMMTDAALQSGTQILIGNTKFLFQGRSLRNATAPDPANSLSVNPLSWNSLSPSAMADMNSPVSAPSTARWQLWHPQAPLEISSSGQWSIGRAGDNALLVNDPTVSSRHAQLTAQDGILTFTDLGSTNGSFINGVRLVPSVSAALRNGDHLQLGQSEFLIRQI